MKKLGLRLFKNVYTPEHAQPLLQMSPSSCSDLNMHRAFTNVQKKTYINTRKRPQGFKMIKETYYASHTRRHFCVGNSHFC